MANHKRFIQAVGKAVDAFKDAYHKDDDAAPGSALSNTAHEKSVSHGIAHRTPPHKTPAPLTDHHAAVRFQAFGVKDAASPDFARLLQDFAHARDNVTLGSLQVIGLCQIRKRFGKDWFNVKNHVLDIAVKTIRSHVSPRDIVGSAMDTAFIIVFASLSGEEATLKCAQIATEINTRLFGTTGEQDMVELSVTTIKKDGVLLSDRLKPSEVITEFLNTEFERMQKTCDIVAEAGNSEAAPRSSGRPDPLDEIAALKRQIPSTEPSRQSFGPLDYTYRPVWNVEKQQIVSNLCIPCRKTAEGGLLLGGRSVFTYPGCPVDIRYDLRTLARIVRDIRDHDDTVLEARFIAPVHFHTLTTPNTLKEFQLILERVPSTLFPAIRFEIISLPTDISKTGVKELLAIIAPYSHDVQIRLRLERLDFWPFDGLGLKGLGVDLNNVTIPFNELQAEFESFANHAMACGLSTFAHGLNTSDALHLALEAGFSEVDGNAVAHASIHPVTSSGSVPQSDH